MVKIREPKSFQEAKVLGIPGINTLKDFRAFQAVMAQQNIVNDTPAFYKVDANTDLKLLSKRITYKVASRKVFDKVDRITQVATDEVDRLMPQFWTWTAQNFMSGTPTLVEQQALAEAGVTWNEYTKRYRDEKIKKGIALGFWHFSGKLAGQFRASRSARRKMFGGSKVTVTPHANFTADILIDPAPALGPTLTGRGFEQKLVDLGFGGNDLMVRKLRGRGPRGYQPLLGPAFTYYVDHVVKDAVIAKLKQAGFKSNTRIRNRAQGLVPGGDITSHGH